MASVHTSCIERNIILTRNNNHFFLKKFVKTKGLILIFLSGYEAMSNQDYKQMTLTYNVNNGTVYNKCQKLHKLHVTQENS